MSANGTSRPGRSHLARGGWAAVIAASVLLAGCTSGHPSAPSSSGRTPPSPIDARVAAGIDHEMALNAPYKRIRAILVQANGHTVFERYYRSTATEYHNIASATKSVMSTLIGIAVGDGKLRLDQPLAQLLPSYASGMTPAVAHTTLRHVLTMTAGLAGSFNVADDLGFATSPDWVRAILTHPAKPPGGSFTYSSGGSHLLSVILITATGQSVLDYARAKLFDPLDVPTRPAFQPLATAGNIDAYQNAGFAWPIDPQRRQLGFGFLKLRPRDMAKIGTLYLNQGRLQGKQILPGAWIRDATTAHVPAADGATPSYGYQWWIGAAAGDPAYLAWGFGGQLIEVVPHRHLVVVISTYFDPRDRSDHGVDPPALTGMVDSVIAPTLPS
jgi:CubicO group peptidase (beta-lactamase class C family)